MEEAYPVLFESSEELWKLFWKFVVYFFAVGISTESAPQKYFY